jgi:hypothetical protein
MKFSFEVGEQEKHTVDFSYDTASTNVQIHVDGVLVASDSSVISFQLVKRYEFTVGKEERHAVVIERERPLIFPAFRAKTYRVFIDGKQVAQHVGH